MSRIHSLTPTFVGHEYFNYVIEETINKEGQNECSLVTVDEHNHEVNRQKI